MLEENEIHFSEEEIEREKEISLELQRKVDALDQEVVEKVKKRITSEFDECEADPSDLEDYFEELDDIRDSLEFELLERNLDPVIDALERRIIFQEFESRIIAAGSNLDAFYEWQEKEDELAEKDENQIYK